MPTCVPFRLRAQVSNAGILNVRRVLTVDSVEETLAVNHLAPFLLTTKLLPLLKKTAESCPDGRGVRVVFVGSDAQRWAKKFNFDDPNLEKARKDARSSLGQHAAADAPFTAASAELLGHHGVQPKQAGQLHVHLRARRPAAGAGRGAQRRTRAVSHLKGLESVALMWRSCARRAT